MSVIRAKGSHRQTAPVRPAEPGWQATLHGLLEPFDPPSLLACFETVAADQVPVPYHTLLVHEHHMTVAMEAHHDEPVRVDVVREHHHDSTYARRSLLRLPSSDRVVQHCTVRIDLSACAPAVREAIIGGETPLGYILIQHKVMRRIVPSAYLRIRGGEPILQVFHARPETVLYGRVATILCDERPAIEVLEIVAPESAESPTCE